MLLLYEIFLTARVEVVCFHGHVTAGFMFPAKPTITFSHLTFWTPISSFCYSFLQSYLCPCSILSTLSTTDKGHSIENIQWKQPAVLPLNQISGVILLVFKEGLDQGMLWFRARCLCVCVRAHAHTHTWLLVRSIMSCVCLVRLMLLEMLGLLSATWYHFLHETLPVSPIHPVIINFWMKFCIPLVKMNVNIWDQIVLALSAMN